MFASYVMWSKGQNSMPELLLIVACAGITMALTDQPVTTDSKMNDLDLLTGSTERHLVDLNASTGNTEPAVMVHHQVVAPLSELEARAADAGFHLKLCSGFRSFERQVHIWNNKLSGLRPVLDAAGAVIDLDTLTPWQQIQAVLRWSALPGASRHHWGTDMDIYDARRYEDNKYTVSLTSIQY